jgi:hypothetical protein
MTNRNLMACYKSNCHAFCQLGAIVKPLEESIDESRSLWWSLSHFRHFVEVHHGGKYVGTAPVTMAVFLYPVASFYFDHDEGTRSRDYKGCFIYLNISQIKCASYFKNHSFISKPINSSKVYICLQKMNYQKR